MKHLRPFNESQDELASFIKQNINFKFINLIEHLATPYEDDIYKVLVRVLLPLSVHDDTLGSKQTVWEYYKITVPPLGDSFYDYFKNNGFVYEIAFYINDYTAPPDYTQKRDKFFKSIDKYISQRFDTDFPQAIYVKPKDNL